MRVGFLFHNFVGGGTETSALNLCRALRRLGAEVDILVGSPEGVLLDSVPKDVGVRTLAKSKFVWPLEIARYLRDERPHVLISDAMIMNVAAVLAKVLARSSTRLRLTEHLIISIDRPFALSRKWLPVPLAMGAYRVALHVFGDDVMTVSRYAAKDMERALCLPVGSVKVTRNSLFLDAPRRPFPDTDLHPWLRQGVPVFLAVGRLIPEKGFDQLIETFAKVRSDVPCRLIIAGDGQERSRLQKLAEDLGITGSVDLVGHSTNPLALMAECSALVMCSRFESFGNVVAEALSVGCPVIAMRCPGGVAETLADGVRGTLVPHQDFVALGDAMRRRATGAAPSPTPSFPVEDYMASSHAAALLTSFGLRSEVS